MRVVPFLLLLALTAGPGHGATRAADETRRRGGGDPAPVASARPAFRDLPGPWSGPASVVVAVRPDPAAEAAAGELLGAIVFGSERIAVEAIDATTLALGPEGAGIAQRGSLQVRDLDADGFADLLALYRIEETGLGEGDRRVCLTGETFAGEPFEGCADLQGGSE